MVITIVSLGMGVVAAVLGHPVMAVPVLIAGYFALKGIKRLPTYEALAARRDEAQLDFPSIVIELKSAPSNQPISRRS